MAQLYTYSAVVDLFVSARSKPGLFAEAPLLVRNPSISLHVGTIVVTAVITGD